MPASNNVPDTHNSLVRARRPGHQFIIVLEDHGRIAVERVGLKNRLCSAGRLDGMIAIAALVRPLGDKIAVGSLRTAGIFEGRRIGGGKPQFQIAIAKTTGIILRPDGRICADE